MKHLFYTIAVCALFACNNSTKKAEVETEKTTNETTAPVTATTEPQAPSPGSPSVTYIADGTEITNYASILVSKDKDKLQPGTPYLCMLTSNAARNNNEYLSVNFLLDTKPGTYPVTGYSFQRGTGDNGEMYGSLLGGKPKLTDYKVVITECKDLGANGSGGHKWSISGYWDEIIIKATPLMLMDKEKNHPAEVKLGKGTFSNLTFDDNWDEMMEKVMEKMK